MKGNKTSHTPGQKTSIADIRPWRDPGAAPFVRLSSITRRFDTVAAVNEVSLDIYKGELFCLLGGSGSGKSTLLRMLAGFEPPDAGTIEIDGQDMAGVPPHERPVNMMFQSYALFPHMNVAANVGYGLKRLKLNKSETLERVNELLKLVKLEDLAKRRPHQLSGGQRQRVALARSLARRPKLLLLDEPLGALDKKLRAETQFELVKIQETLGITFIVVTHDAEEAMSLATRISVMDEGYIAQIGEPQEIYEYPSSRYVAEIVGSINIFQAQVIENTARDLSLYAPETGARIKLSNGAACAPGQTVWFGIRPEKLVLQRDKPKNDANFARGLVEELIYLGDTSVYRVILTSGKRITVTRPNIARPRQNAISWDEQVYVTWSPKEGTLLTS